MPKLIGTAGHVDHGKTSLIRALTGIDADRLPEEKQRGMTIDIGFAYLDLPIAGRVSIVDVPGHERLVHNMLTGALGVDVALLCVAADEGVRAQTREHLQILDLLPIEQMVVAITRADLADPVRRQAVSAEISELLGSTRFARTPIIEASSLTGEGIDKLRAVLESALASTDQRSRAGPWYLPIDRVFTVKGQGCVVTGTMARGEVEAGDTASIEPGHLIARVRSIHSHGQMLEKGESGRRIALNLNGVKREDLRRGQIAAAPGSVFCSKILDAEVRWIEMPKHAERVRVAIGAEDAIARVFLSDSASESVQLRFENEVACVKGESLILRRYSPSDLLGGGKVTVPQAKARRKLGADNVKIVEGDELIGVLTAYPAGVDIHEAARLLGDSAQDLESRLIALENLSAAMRFGNLCFSRSTWGAARQRFLNGLESAHKANPERGWVPRESALSMANLSWNGKPLDRILAVLAEEGLIHVKGTLIRAPGFKLALNTKQRALLDRIEAELDSHGINVLLPQDLAKNLRVPPQAVDEILRLGIEADEVVKVEEGIFYTKGQIEDIASQIRQKYGGAAFSAAEFRDKFGTSRKYAIPLLEYFDRVGLTLRTGDRRALR